jgi:hypothetical protein
MLCVSKLGERPQGVCWVRLVAVLAPGRQSLQYFGMSARYALLARLLSCAPLARLRYLALRPVLARLARRWSLA